MCHFQHLHSCAHGYVVRCAQCGYYQVAFESTLLTLGYTDYHMLQQTVRSWSVIDFEAYQDKHMKQLVLPTASDKFHLLLSQHDLERLHNLLDAADSEEKALGLLGLFYKND